MVASPTYTHALQLQDDTHIQSLTASLPPSVDPCVLSEPIKSTISQGLSFVLDPSFSLHSPTVDSSYQRHRTSVVLLSPRSSSHIRSRSLCSRVIPNSSQLVRNGKSDTHLDHLVENPSSYFSTRKPISMLATEGNPTACFTLTSPLLPPSLATTSATAPPPSSSSSSRKKPKTRLTLNALPRFPAPPSHTSQSHMNSGMSNSMTSHYQYSTQYGQYSSQYSQHGSQYVQQQQSYLSAQQQLQLHQKDLIQQATRGSLPSHLLFPSSPRLIPMGSPGPVTPLTLEESQGGYLFAGSQSNPPGVPFLQQREMDKLAAIAAAQN